MALVRLEGTSSDVPVLSPEKGDLWRAVPVGMSQQEVAMARISTPGLHYDQHVIHYQGLNTVHALPAQIVAMGEVTSVLRGEVVDWSGPIGAIAKSLVRHDKVIREAGANAGLRKTERAQAIDPKFWEKITTKPETWQAVDTELRKAQLLAVSRVDDYIRKPNVDIWLTHDGLHGHQPFRLVKLGGLAIRDVPRETLDHENLLRSFDVYPICVDVYDREGMMSYDSSRAIFYGMASGLGPT